MGIADLIQGQMDTAGQPREITQETTMDPGTDIGSDLSSIGMLIMTLLQMQAQQGKQDDIWKLMFGQGGQQPGLPTGSAQTPPVGFGGFPGQGVGQQNPADLFKALLG